LKLVPNPTKNPPEKPGEEGLTRRNQEKRRTLWLGGEGGEHAKPGANRMLGPEKESTWPPDLRTASRVRRLRVGLIDKRAVGRALKHSWEGVV